MSDLEEKLEKWREEYKKYKAIQTKNVEIEKILEELENKTKKRLNEESSRLYYIQKDLYSDDFLSLQINKTKPMLMELLKDVPFNSDNNTTIESLTDVCEYIYSPGSRSEATFAHFKFADRTVEVKSYLIFDAQLYPKKNIEILKAVVKFNPPTLEFVKTVEADGVSGGSCDVCGHNFGINPNPMYFPLISSVGNHYWCCQLCQKFLRRYLKEDGKSDLIENIATESDLMNIQPALKF